MKIINNNNNKLLYWSRIQNTESDSNSITERDPVELLWSNPEQCNAKKHASNTSVSIKQKINNKIRKEQKYIARY